jgi:ankyrin repeat protein
VDAVRLLLEHGADPNIREAGDNTYPLHWAAARGHIETVRALLDSGGDVHGFGDVHELDVIGWATFHRAPDEDPRAVVSLLLERGARHHIFSGICVGDLDLIQQLVEQNPEALDRRMSHFEQGQTPLHLAISRQQGMHDVTLWFYTGQVDNLYQLLKSGQAEFVEDINDTFYGAREFGIRDPNGYTLYFIRPEAPR